MTRTYDVRSTSDFVSMDWGHGGYDVAVRTIDGVVITVLRDIRNPDEAIRIVENIRAALRTWDGWA